MCAMPRPRRDRESTQVPRRVAPIRRHHGPPWREADRQRDSGRGALSGALVRTGPMRELANRYLRREISRRDFVRLSAAAGFSVAATRSAIGALEPMAGSGAEAAELT